MRNSKKHASKVANLKTPKSGAKRLSVPRSEGKRSKVDKGKAPAEPLEWKSVAKPAAPKEAVTKNPSQPEQPGGCAFNCYTVGEFFGVMGDVKTSDDDFGMDLCEEITHSASPDVLKALRKSKYDICDPLEYRQRYFQLDRRSF